jgi:hypothetical protein
MPAPFLIPSPPQPAPLGLGTYTTWPGGVDPTARLFNTDNTKIPCVGTWAGAGGRRRKSRKGSRKNRKSSRKTSRKNRKSSCKNRKGSRKNRKTSRKNRKSVSRKD